jgi:hypothetical protein
MGLLDFFKPVGVQAGDQMKAWAQEATKPSVPEISMNPDDYKGFDSSALRRSMEQNLARRSSQSRAQALAGLSKAGIKGADTMRAISDIEGQQEQARGDLNAQLAYQDYLSRINERDFALRKQQSDFARALAEWQGAWAPMQKQREDQEALLGDILGAGAKFGGAWAGGR